MRWELGASVEEGEIVNTCPNQVHGWLRLSGVERPVYLNLTGNMSSDLAGRRVSFKAVPKLIGDGPPIPQLSRQQIGPTGDMTMAAPGGLRLEWHGQDGLVLCQMELAECQSSEPDEFASTALDPTDRGLFSQIGSLAGLDSPPAIAETWEDRFEILDVLMEDVESEVPIRSLVSPLLEMPDVHTMSGQELELKVKELLAHLALLGVCLEMCHHFKPIDAYQMLTRLMVEDQMHPQSPSSGYILHYLTFEHCPLCVAEEASWVEAETDGDRGGEEEEIEKTGDRQRNSGSR